MGINFPSAPLIGDKHPTPPVAGVPVYTWDGEKWTAVSAAAGVGAGIIASDTPPANALDNSVWLETDTGILYFRWNDGNSSQWVALTGATGLADAVRYSTAQTLTDDVGATAGQKSVARGNIYAAPMDAMMYSGIQINGNMAVSQETAPGTALTYPGDGITQQKYISDAWWIAYKHATVAMTAVVDAFGGGTVSGVNHSTHMGATTNMTPLAADDLAILGQTFENWRWSPLNYGNSNSARPVTIGFWVYSTTVIGWAAISIRNWGPPANRSYVVPFNISLAGVWEYKTVTVPPDVAGTWSVVAGAPVAMISFCFASGSNYITPTPGAWVNGNFVGVAGMSNFLSVGGARMHVSGVGIFPGIDAPSKERFSQILRPTDQEFVLCQRYYQKYPGYIFNGNTTATCYGSIPLPMMRAGPTVSFENLTYSGASGLAVNGGTYPNMVRWNLNATGVSTYARADVICSARM